MPAASARHQTLISQDSHDGQACHDSNFYRPDNYSQLLRILTIYEQETCRAENFRAQKGDVPRHMLHGAAIGTNTANSHRESTGVRKLPRSLGFGLNVVRTTVDEQPIVALQYSNCSAGQPPSRASSRTSFRVLNGIKRQASCDT